jgi:hypothetical protein
MPSGRGRAAGIPAALVPLREEHRENPENLLPVR